MGGRCAEGHGAPNPGPIWQWIAVDGDSLRRPKVIVRPTRQGVIISYQVALLLNCASKHYTLMLESSVRGSCSIRNPGPRQNPMDSWTDVSIRPFNHYHHQSLNYERLCQSAFVIFLERPFQQTFCTALDFAKIDRLQEYTSKNFRLLLQMVEHR